MVLIGAVALIVIGPEKLPRVARTVGTLLGKAQRYVADVKAEVNRSIELEELQEDEGHSSRPRRATSSRLASTAGASELREALADATASDAQSAPADADAGPIPSTGTRRRSGA